MQHFSSPDFVTGGCCKMSTPCKKIREEDYDPRISALDCCNFTPQGKGSQNRLALTGAGLFLFRHPDDWPGNEANRGGYASAARSRFLAKLQRRRRAG